MKWDDDPNCYEKRIVFDAIVDFSREFDGVDPEDISIRLIFAFVDEFFERKIGE